MRMSREIQDIFKAATRALLNPHTDAATNSNAYHQWVNLANFRYFSPGKQQLIDLINEVLQETPPAQADTIQNLRRQYLYALKAWRIDRDYNSAILFFDRMIAKADQTLAQSSEHKALYAQIMGNRARMYECGEGSPVNRQMAARLYLRAKALGNLTAVVNYAEFLLTQSNEANQAEAATLHDFAISRGSVSALFQRAEMHLKGIHGPIEANTAFRLFQQAAEQGHSGAMNYCGIMCEEGLGVDINREAAVRWYGQSIEWATSNAMYRRALMHLRFQEGPNSRAEAVRLMDLAVEANNQWAKTRRPTINIHDRNVAMALVELTWERLSENFFVTEETKMLLRNHSDVLRAKLHEAQDLELLVKIAQPDHVLATLLRPEHLIELRTVVNEALGLVIGQAQTAARLPLPSELGLSVLSFLNGHGRVQQIADKHYNRAMKP